MNAKKELLEILKQHNVIPRCAVIEYKRFEIEGEMKLSEGYSDKELALFLNDLNFEYNNGYRSQRLFGTVWLTNGGWLERHEYDGAEWWEYKILPQIPENLAFNHKA